MTDQAKPPIWFWIIGSFALLWNGMGLAAYFQQFMMSAEFFAALRPEQQQLLIGQPIWLTGAFATAVFAGFVGSISILLRKRIAVRLYLLSMLAVFIQFGGLFLVFRICGRPDRWRVDHADPGTDLRSRAIFLRSQGRTRRPSFLSRRC